MNILVTGATSGIGRDLAHILAFRGHKVFACCHTDDEFSKKKCEVFKSLEYIKFDITNDKDYDVIDDLDIDVLINLAAIGIGGALLDLNIGDIKENFDVNVFSTLSLNKYFIEYCNMRKKQGRILIVSSLAGYLPIPFLGSYVATKSSLIMLTKVLRYELMLSNVSQVDVKLILPGTYATGFNQYMISNISKSKYFNNYEKNYEVMNLIFKSLEKKSNRTIVNKMVKACEDDSRKFIYSAPLMQKELVKIYRCLTL